MLYEHMKMLQQQGVQILSPKIAGWEIPVVAVEKILLECLEILLLEKSQQVQQPLLMNSS